MERTVSINLSTKLNCCIGDKVTLNVKAVHKLLSYGSACEFSGVPALIIGAGLNSNGTFSYVFRYDCCVLKECCNYLIPQDIESVCCLHECCGEHKCGCGGHNCGCGEHNCGCKKHSCEPIAPCNFVRTCCE